ncbi:hypothetical protein T09_7520 [Trichinella sp. T9]|nr:hypothetical protein T09_7520 [Trichinella sp. T9]
MDHKATILVVNLNPESIICDFETALIPAIQGYFPNTRVQGCYFHFCQAVHRKVGELGLKTRYHQHEETRRKIRMLLTTAFLPVPHVNTGVSLSGNVTVGDLRRVNKVYAQKQRQVAQYTGEYTNGRRTLEQFLEALMYITPEPI